VLRMAQTDRNLVARLVELVGIELLAHSENKQVIDSR
jgi:hypothetical protein